MASSIENKALKQQFESLQKQQQEKLLRRKQKKEEKSKSATLPKPDTAASVAFGVDDDLELKLADPPAQGSIYSEELVNHLNDQIREMKDESGRLYKLLSERDLELRQLRKKQAPDKTGGVTNDTAATKIVELSKKVRELTADLEKEKTKCKVAAKRNLELENELVLIKDNIPTANTKKVVPPSARTIRSEAGDMTDLELKSIQDKLKHAEAKVAEYRNSCQIQKKELAMAQKVLEQEVGEGVSIQQLMNNSGGWRGRAQQIITLQKKVNELKSQADQGSRSGDADDLESEFMGTTSRKNKMEERQREQLRRMEKERKENYERMTNELKALESDHEALKGKLEASKARNKVLANENKSSKHQIQTLLEKGRHDDELIEALFKQQSQLKSALDQTEQKKQEISQEKEQTLKSNIQKDQKEKNLIDQLSAIVAEKESKVQSLEHEIEQLKLSHLQKAQVSGVNQIFEQSSSRPSSSNSFGNRPISVDATVVEDYGTMTPAPQESYRPESSQANQQPPAPHVFPVQNSARPQSSQHQANPQLTQEFDELRLQCQEYKSLCQAATVERDKLSELVQVLQNRMQEYTAKVNEAQEEVIALKRKNVELERRLGKASMEKGQSAATRRTKSKISLQSINFEEDPFSGEASKEEIQTQLEIQKDENEALKAALQSTLEAKEEDLRVYNQMLEETKSIFLQGLRQYRQSTKS